MYDPRQPQYGAYPIQALGYPAQPQPGQVGYTQPPVPYMPQGQQMMQQVPNRPQMPQPQPQENVASIRARYINSPEDIQLGEVPMDGSMPLFMMSDKSVIIGKYWDKDAQLKTARYLREPDNEPANRPQVPMVQTVIDPDISNRLDRLEQLVNRCIQAVEQIPTQEAPVSVPKTTAKKVSNNG